MNSEGKSMPEQEDTAEPNVRAEGDSVAVGRVTTGDVHGHVVIGKDVRIYAATEDEAPLSSAEIESGLQRLRALLPERAPILQDEFEAIAQTLSATLGADARALSPSLKKQREEQLETVKAMCMEVTDISFHALCTGQTPPRYNSTSPFPGLKSFGPKDRAFFFGREELTARLVERIESYPFLAVLGASGSGKSSLVMAGLLPALGLEDGDFRPGANPLDALAKAQTKPLIVVDQFEELFTFTKDRKIHEQFIDRLIETIRHKKVVITLRSDFLDEVGEYRSLSQEIQSHLEIVPPMNAVELRRSMEGQANAAGLCFEADLGQQILEDVEGEPGAMPLLQHALWELWKRRHGRWLLAREYRAFGGVKQAITRTAESVYGNCTRAEQDLLRNIFLQLTRLDDQTEGRDTRRRVPVSELIPAAQNAETMTTLLEKLAQERLIVMTSNGDATEVEVAHEALIRHWERLRTWINANRKNLLLQRQLEQAADHWNRSGRDRGDLYRGRNLSRALQWARTPSSEISPVGLEFLEASRAEQVKVRRHQIYLWASLAGAFFITVVLIFSVTGWWNRMRYRPPELQFVNVLAGDFTMGSDDMLFPNERPPHSVFVEEFEIGTYEVTNREYELCVNAGICRAPRDPGKIRFDSDEYADHPVTSISWVDAVTFCKWIGGRLPTEAEWEKAARGGDDERAYPWGDDYHEGYANIDTGRSSAVGSYPEDVSPSGAFDMAGNAWEWMANHPYDYQEGHRTDEYVPGAFEQDDGLPRMVRGGTWDMIELFARTSYRSHADPELVAEAGGFRCARNVAP
jgi:formylglycine-generating enzyme required for sulfatase activity